MALYKIQKLAPDIAKSAYIFPGAVVIGNVRLGAYTSAWPAAVLRADNDAITIGERSNVQDGAVLHTDPGCPLVIGDDVTIGHQAVLHGCSIGNGSLVGIGATVLNHAIIGENCLVGAGALVTEGKNFPDNSLIVGVPAKVVRSLTDAEIASIRQNARDYVERSAVYREGLAVVSESSNDQLESTFL